MISEPSSSMVDQLVRKCVKQNIPYAVQFELTNKCNLKCRHCFMVEDEGNELSLDEVRGIIDQLVDMGTFYLAFTGGEIFTRKDLFDILRYAKSKGFFLTLMTNGTLIGQEQIEEIKKLKPVKFEISLYGATAIIHDNITGVKGSFKHTMSAIEALLQQGVGVIIKTPLMNLNVKESNDIASLCNALGVKHRMNPGIAPARDGLINPQQYDLSDKDLISYLLNHDLDLSYLMEIESTQRFSCKAGKAACCITAGGIVYPCVMMPIPVGNLRERSLKEIWHEPSYDLKRLRTLTSEDMVSCAFCHLAEYCIRCPGVVYLETGDLVGASPSACRYAAYRDHTRNLRGIKVMQTVPVKNGQYYIRR